MTGIHFAHPSNRFWPALRNAGIIDWAPNLNPIAPAVPLGGGADDCFAPANHHFPALWPADLIDGPVDSDQGMTDRQRGDLIRVGIGITNLVNRATARASELTRDELRKGARRLAELVTEVGPLVVAVAGVTAFREAFARPGAGLGHQATNLGRAQLWVVPNPSGLNAHETIDTLSAWYLRVADAAGIV